MNQKVDEIVNRLGLTLPHPAKPVGVYQPVVLSGGFAFLSGQLSKDAEGRLVMGKVGQELNLEQARQAARLALLQAVSLIRSEIGLERFERVVRMVGFIQSAPDFYAHSEVMNAASELWVEIFGEKGKHVRTSIGVASLPLNAAVEIELTLKLQ